MKTRRIVFLILMPVAMLVFFLTSHFFSRKEARDPGEIHGYRLAIMDGSCGDICEILTEYHSLRSGAESDNRTFLEFAMMREARIINTDPVRIDPREVESFAMYLFFPLGRYKCSEGDIVVTSRL